MPNSGPGKHLLKESDAPEEACPQRGGFGFTAWITDSPRVSQTCSRNAPAAALQKQLHEADGPPQVLQHPGQSCCPCSHPSLQHCHCSPPAAPMTNTIMWKNKLSHLQTTTVAQPSSGQLPHLKMLWGDCKEECHRSSHLHPKEAQRHLSWRKSQVGSMSSTGIGKTLGKTIWTLLAIQQMAPVAGRHHLELEWVHMSPTLSSHAPPLHAPGTLSLSPRKNACYFLQLPHSQGFLTTFWFCQQKYMHELSSDAFSSCPEFQSKVGLRDRQQILTTEQQSLIQSWVFKT